jgi:hypothetical protein
MPLNGNQNYFSSYEDEDFNWQRLEDEISMNNQQQRSNASAILSASGDDNDDEQMDIDSMVFRSKVSQQ